MFRFPIPFVVGTLLACSVACSSYAQSPTSLAVPIARIINGQPTDAYEAVGIIGSVQAGGFCTGTLISPTHVLTAGHCAQFIDGDTQATFEVGGQTYRSQQISIHPAFDSLTLENDVAVIELTEPVANVTPAAIFRGTPLVGDELIIVGFGAGGTPEGGASGAFGDKRVGVTFVDDVDELFVYWTFDDQGEANTAPGDSGGPGFLEVAGELYIATVTSGGTKSDASLGDIAFNARVDTFQAWIDSIAGVTDPTDETPTDETPTDEQGTDDDLGTDDQDTGDDSVDGDPDCSRRPLKQAVREIFAAVLNFLASDSFVQLLQSWADELSESAESAN